MITDLYGAYDTVGYQLIIDMLTLVLIGKIEECAAGEIEECAGANS